MPPKRNFVPTSRHGVGTADMAEIEGTTDLPDAAMEAAREHEANQARGDRSIVARIRRWLFPSPINPNKPHEFTVMDPLTALGRGAATSGRREGAMAAGVLFAESDAASDVCRLPGCGRPADDPIHA